MKKSSLLTNSVLGVLFVLLSVFSPMLSTAQIKKDTVVKSKGTKTSKTVVKRHKKVAKTRHHEVVHHSDSDQDLEQIKAAKNKQKGIH